MIKDTIAIFVMAVCAHIAHAASPAIQTPNVVSVFYRTLKQMSSASNDNQAYDYREIITNCFRGKEDNGINVPNDFYDWGYAKVKTMSSNSYAQLYEDFSYRQKRFRMDRYEIVKNQYRSEADFGKYKSQRCNIVQTVVRKTMTNGTKSKNISDTLITEGDQIVVFRNSLFSGKSDKDEVDIEVLRVKAADYYSSGYYRLAYQAYIKIIELDPKNANAYYRLGVMTYYKKGCYPRNARKESLKYLEKAKELKYGEKAEWAIYFVRHGGNTI